MSECPHKFLFAPGDWLGEGTIQLNLVQEPLKFFTSWKVGSQAGAAIECMQEVEVKGLSERMSNAFDIQIEDPGTLLIKLENDSIGSVKGRGLWDDKVVAWEYEKEKGGEFEGFEIFELQKDGTYLFRSEFISQDQLRSSISGKLWLKGEAK